MRDAKREVVVKPVSEQLRGQSGVVHGKRDGVEQEQVLVQHFTGMKL